MMKERTNLGIRMNAASGLLRCSKFLVRNSTFRIVVAPFSGFPQATCFAGGSDSSTTLSITPLCFLHFPAQTP